MIELITIEAEPDSSRGTVNTLENKGRETVGNIHAAGTWHNPHLPSRSERGIHITFICISVEKWLLRLWALEAVTSGIESSFVIC